MPYYTVYGHTRPKVAALSTPAPNWRSAVSAFTEKYPGYRPDQWEGPGDTCGDIAGVCEGCAAAISAEEPHHHRDGVDGVWCDKCKE